MTDTTPTPVDTLVSDIALHLIQGAARAGDWDVPPMLMLVVAGDRATLVLVDIHTDIWRDEHPATVLWLIAGGLETGDIKLDEISGGADLTRLAGVILTVEMYGLEAAGEEGIQEAREWSKHHSLADHPSGQAREMRSMTITDLAGNIGFITHVRGEDPPTDVRPGSFTGRLPRAVTRLMTVLKASTT